MSEDLTNSVRLVLKLETGIHPDTAKPLLRSVSFGSVNPQIQNADLHTVAQTMASLSSYPLRGTLRNDSMALEG